MSFKDFLHSPFMRWTCLLVVAPAPLKEQRGGHQLERVALAAVEEEEEQVRVLLHSHNHTHVLDKDKH
jgi:hypothetical protein